MRTERIFGVMLVAIIALGFGGREFGRAVRHDLHADIAWANVDAPAELTSRAYRYYPLTYPVLERWTFGADATRATYALATIRRFGGLPARIWFAHALESRSSWNYGPTISAQDLPVFGVVTPEDRLQVAQRIITQSAQFDQDTLASSILPSLAQALGPEMLGPLTIAMHAAPPLRRTQLEILLPYPDDHWTASQRAGFTRLQHAFVQQDMGRGEPPPTPLARAAERLTNGDTKARAFFARIVDGNLHVFSQIDYAPNLIAVSEAFPHSRLSKGYRAYDAIRGGSYFDRDETSDNDETRAIGMPQAWRAWLDTYPDHPGADDAAYWLARGLQAKGDRVGALRVLLTALEQNLGDGDMFDVIGERALWLLDVGMSDDELAQAYRQNSRSPLAATAQYALAVRAAREHHYALALQLEPQTINELARHVVHDHLTYAADTILPDLHAQRELWQRLSMASAEEEEAIWNTDDAWKIGYLALFNGSRIGGAAYAFEPGTPRAENTRNMQLANVNAQIIALAATTLHGNTRAIVVQRERERIIDALYEQLLAFPDDETAAMGRLPDLSPAVGADAKLFTAAPTPLWSGISASDAARYHAQDEISVWWIRELLHAVANYVSDYPHAEYTSTALLCAFEATGETRYLTSLLQLAPDDPRSEEARALLWRSQHPQH